ncbi:8-amino-7-oxononanoate synthase [Candidatus Sumerlaeota bacterium]|nr:8-amino-7-oxononanoate synthase [Candidatus Sumerlaeota bacterium]
MRWRQRLRRRREALESKNLLRRMVGVRPGSDGCIARADGTFIDFCSNDYLGLSRDQEVIRAAGDAVARYGAGARASRLITGNYELLEELEAELAAFKGMEAATVFPSGYAANLGACSVLMEPGDVVFVDRLSHACLVDGVRLSGAKLRVFPHNDLKKLEELLKKESCRKADADAARWILCDGVYSMDGDFAPLPGLLKLAEDFSAVVVMDDAHATGVAGARGRGTAEHFGIDPGAHMDRLIVTATLSKAIGAQGGVVLGSHDVREAIVNSARPFVYTTGLAPAAAGAAIAALQIIRREPERVTVLQHNAARAREALLAGGMNILQSETCVIPVVLGDAQRALDASARLRDEGILVLPVRPPTVPRGTSRLRLTVTARIAEDALRECCGKVVATCQSLLAHGARGGSITDEV